MEFKLEMSAHRCPQGFRRPNLRAIIRQQDLAETGGGGAAQNRTKIARILNAVEEDRIPIMIKTAGRLRRGDDGHDPARCVHLSLIHI